MGLDILQEQLHLGCLTIFGSSWNPKLQREAQTKNNGGNLNFLRPQKEYVVKFGGKVRD
jgi:hypothetical protein